MIKDLKLAFRLLKFGKIRPLDIGIGVATMVILALVFAFIGNYELVHLIFLLLILEISVIPVSLLSEVLYSDFPLACKSSKKLQIEVPVIIGLLTSFAGFMIFIIFSIMIAGDKEFGDILFLGAVMCMIIPATVNMFRKGLALTMLFTAFVTAPVIFGALAYRDLEEPFYFGAKTMIKLFTRLRYGRWEAVGCGFLYMVTIGIVEYALLRMTWKSEESLYTRKLKKEMGLGEI